MSTEPVSFHAAAIAVAASNNWDYAFALGYVSGKFDKADGRPAEHRTNEHDDYALGYHRGYMFSCPKGYGECENARACQYPGRCNR